MSVGDATFHPGETFAGRYRLVRPIGEGAMGAVWEACQLTTDKPVAIKILKRSEASDRSRFLREAKVAAGLTHRNIVQVFDYWEVEGNGPVFIVMELLAGETLGAWLARERRMQVGAIPSVLLPVASALRAAHALGVVHRDLKPDNIFLVRGADGESPEVKVLDFGLAKPIVADSTTTSVTQTGSVMGTPFYMAPEQVYGDKDVDGQADVWAFGVVLYECLSGTKPFVGDNFGQIFRTISQASPRPLRDVAPHVPPALDALVKRMLSHERHERPRMTEVFEQLSTLAARPSAAPVPVAPAAAPMTQILPAAPSLSRPGPMPATMMAASTSVQRTSTRSTNMLGISIGLGAVALVAVALGAVVALRPPRVSPAVITLDAPPVRPSSLPTVVVPGTIAATAESPPVVASATATSSASLAVSTPPPLARATTSREPKGPNKRPASSSSPPANDPLGGGRF